MILINVIICMILTGYAVSVFTEWPTWACILIGFFSYNLYSYLISIPKLRNIFFIIFGIADGIVTGYLAIALIDEFVYKDATLKLSNNQFASGVIMLIAIVIMIFINKSSADKELHFSGWYWKSTANKVHKNEQKKFSRFEKQLRKDIGDDEYYDLIKNTKEFYLTDYKKDFIRKYEAKHGIIRKTDNTSISSEQPENLNKPINNTVTNFDKL